MPKLDNVKHEAFAQLLVEGEPAVTAYEKAGYKPNRGNAGRLKENEHIQARVAELQRHAAKRHDVTMDRIIEELARIAFGDVREFFDENGCLKSVKDLSDAAAASLASIEVVAGGITKVKRHDKIQALKLLGEHLQMFTKKVDVTLREAEATPVSDEEELQRFREKLDRIQSARRGPCRRRG